MVLSLLNSGFASILSTYCCVFVHASIPNSGGEKNPRTSTLPEKNTLGLALCRWKYPRTRVPVKGGSPYPGMGASVLGQKLRGEKTSLGRKLPRSCCLGGGHVL